MTEDVLKQRKLGATDIMVSPLGLGTVKFGRDQQVKYPWKFNIPDDKQVVELLSLCQAHNINLIDTAPAYGNSEVRLGQLLPNRNDWVIVSKVGETFENGLSRFDFSAKTTINTIEQSLVNLKTDFLDLVLVHSHGEDMEIINRTDVIDTLLELKQQGKVRAFGMSTKTTEGGLWCVENTDAVMAVRNRTDHTDDPVLDKALQLNKGVVIKKGLQSGHADTKAGGGGIQDAIQYVFAHKAVHCLIAGTINPKHLLENIRLVKRFSE